FAFSFSFAFSLSFPPFAAHVSLGPDRQWQLFAVAAGEPAKHAGGQAGQRVRQSRHRLQTVAAL
ncbi:MAG: hypothetical protein Q8P67_29120, partial [archaeon]|nr:hypothetical protein [archaeon]